MSDYLRSELRCERCGGQPLRQTTWFCQECDGMRNPRKELLEARAEIDSLRQQLADSSAIATGAVRAAVNNAEEIERLRAANHVLRSLLETAADAWDSGQWNSLLGVQMCGLPVAWREKIREVNHEQ